MKLTIDPILIIVGLLVIAFLCFAVMKGCSNNQGLKAENTMLASQLSQRKSDSLKFLSEKAEYEYQLTLQEGQLDLKENQLMAKNDSLGIANTRIEELLAKYKPITPNADTSATFVPNEYIDECAQCFGELSNDRLLVGRYKSASDSLLKVYKQQKTLDSTQIVSLNEDNKSLQNGMSNALQIAQQAAEVKRKLFLSFATIAVNHNYPTGVGGGLLYMDKRYRVFGLHYFFTAQGPVYEGQVAFPLSLKSN